MNGRRLILNDGTIIEGGEAGYDSGFLRCWISDFPITEAAQIFLNPDKTAVIVFEYGEMSDRYEGFTDCRSISINVDGLTSVCMVRGVTENVGS